MKIKIELDDGYEQVFEVDEEQDEIEDLGTTKELMQARINELEALNRDKSGDIAFYREANTAYQKEINTLRDKATGWDKRCEELEQELRDAQDRIHEQDWTIGKYDDENRELRERLRKCGDEPIKVSLNEWAKCIHENAVAHGWWTGVIHNPDFSSIRDDVDRPLPEILMLCVCELAESMEEYRDGKPLIYEGENCKPEGIAVEMVDCIIRILDWMGHNGVDVDELIRKKHAYNIGRPYRHGGKRA